MDLSPNAHPVHFPFDVRAFENGDGCAEQPVPLIEGNQQSPEVVSQLVDAQKPFVVQRSRFIGKGRDDVVCYEQEVRLVNPQNTTGRLNQYRLQAVLPGTTEGGNTRLLALTRCDRVRCDNCAGEGVQGCPADSQSPDDPEIVPPIECPDGSEFTQLEPTEPGTRLILDLQQAQSNNSIPGGGSAVLRYVVATRIPSGFDAPNFLTGRGGFGNRAIWTDETTPISLDLDFDDLSHGIETRFGFGGGGTGRERGDPGTGTSTRDPDDPDQTLATVSAVRAVSDGTVGVFEFETAAEILTGGFQVYFAEGSQWRETGPFLLTRPHRSAGVYRAELPFAPGDSVEVKIVEYELDGTTRLHGPYSLGVAQAPVAPELGTDGGWSAESSATDMPPLVPLNGRRTPGPSDRGRFVVPSSGVYRVPYTSLADALDASGAQLAARAAAGQLSLTHRGKSVTYHADQNGLWFWADEARDGHVEGLDYVVALSDGALVTSVDFELPAANPVETHLSRLQFEEDKVAAVGTESYDPRPSYWMWQYLLAGAGDDAQFRLDFDAPDASEVDGELTLKVRGGSETQVYPDHVLSVT
ncbi:MAG: hypothetical protein AAFQ82_20520, partial [Myxococcota bacterium]